MCIRFIIGLCRVLSGIQLNIFTILNNVKLFLLLYQYKTQSLFKLNLK